MKLELAETSQAVETYLARVRVALEGLPFDRREYLLSYARAQIELDTELEVAGSEEERVATSLARLGDPARFAQQLRATVVSPDESPAEAMVEQEAKPLLKPCRACRKEISLEALACPHCGAPFPARLYGPASGYEWKSKARVFGIPLVHVAFGRDKNGKLRVAKGIIAIGQFGIGAITIAQFGIGAVFGLGQFVAAPLAIGQFAFGLAAAGQFGIGILLGAGQFATGLKAWGLVKLSGL